MSFIRSLEKRKYSVGKTGLYVYPIQFKDKTNGIEFCSVGRLDTEDFVEVMFRILDRSDVKFKLEDVNNVRKELYLNKIRRIKSDWETSKAYFGKMFKTEKEYNKFFSIKKSNGK